MKQSIISIICKSIWRNMRPKLLIIVVVFLSITFLLSYVNYREISTKINMQNGYSSYGCYQLKIYDVTRSTTERIMDDTSLIRSTLIYSKQTNDRQKKLMYTSPDIFELANYELLLGDFPTTKDEVICEQKYLNQIGFSFEENSEIQIEIDEKKYTVTGVIQTNDFVRIIGIYIPVFIFNFSQYEDILDPSDANYSVLYTTEKNLIDERSRVITEYNLNDQNIAFNNNVLAYAAVDSSGKTTDLFIKACDYLLYLISAFLIALFVSLFSLICKNTKETIAVYSALGVPKTKILLSVFVILASLFLIVTSFLFLVSQGVIGLLLHELNFVEIFVLNCSIVLPYDFLCVILSLFSFLHLWPKDISLALTNRENISINKSTKQHEDSSLLSARCPFWKMARMNVSMYAGKQVVSIIGLVVAIVFTTVFLYISHYIYIDSGEYQYDYRVDYTYSTFPDELNGTEENYKKYIEMTQKTNLFDVFPYYHQINLTKIRKKNLSEPFVKYLRSSSTYSFKELDHIDNSLYENNCFIIGANEDQLKRVYKINNLTSYDLADDECIVVKCVRTPDGVGFETGLHEGDAFFLSHTLYVEEYGAVDDDIAVSVKEVVDGINLPLSNCYYMPIIIVNSDVFAKIANYDYDYPQQIFLNSKSDHDQILEFFKGCSGMVVTDLTREKKQIDEQRIVSGAIVLSCSLLLVLVLIINTTINYLDKFQKNRKQLATLKAIGVNNIKLLLFLIYEIIYVAVISVVLGTIVSLASCYLVYLYIRKSLFFFTFEILPFIYFVPMLSVTIVTLLLIIIFWKVLKHMNIIEYLQKE